MGVDCAKVQLAFFHLASRQWRCSFRKQNFKSQNFFGDIMINIHFTSKNINLGERVLLLLGIHWGQFPEMWEIAGLKKNKESVRKESLIIEGGYVKGLSGMTCVAPAWSIADTLNMPRFKDARMNVDAAIAQQVAEDVATVPVAESEPPTMGNNPDHREDFSRLVDAAVSGNKQGSGTS